MVLGDSRRTDSHLILTLESVVFMQFLIIFDQVKDSAGPGCSKAV